MCAETWAMKCLFSGREVGERRRRRDRPGAQRAWAVRFVLHRPVLPLLQRLPDGCLPGSQHRVHW